MRCTQLLMDDHKVILRALEILRAMATMTEQDQDVAPDDVHELLEFLRDYADESHQGKEESVLFPVLLNAKDRAQAGPTHAMIFEHDQERSLASRWA